jgi:CDP-diacylglycerol pyrophosphatase
LRPRDFSDPVPFKRLGADGILLNYKEFTPIIALALPSMVYPMKAPVSRSRVLASLMLALVAGPSLAADRSALWHVVESCLVSTVEHYCETCPAPLEGTACARGAACPATTQVWNRSQDYVVIRDVKACGCPADFVHGLAMPLKRITGLGDGTRPEGIWEFAWSTARQRIADDLSIGLIMNPAGWRTQDQLHIHILRLRGDVRAHLNERASKLPSLDSVWSTAARIADAAALGDGYGVLVARDPDGDYLLVVDTAPLETIYGQGRCI